MAHGHVAWLGADVRDQQGSAAFGNPSGQSLAADLQPGRVESERGIVRGRSGAVLVHHLVALDEADADVVVAERLLDHPGGLRQHLFKVEVG